jgi:hypothetical protein
MAKPLGSQKFGGRQKGTTNKITKELRERIKDFLENNFEKIELDFSKLEPIQKVTVFSSYLKFVLPALQASSVDLNISKLSDEELNQLLQTLTQKNDDTQT